MAGALRMRIEFDPHYDSALVDFTPGRQDLVRTRGRFGYNSRGQIVTADLVHLRCGVNLRGVPRADEIARQLRAKGYRVIYPPTPPE